MSRFRCKRSSEVSLKENKVHVETFNMVVGVETMLILIQNWLALD